VEPADGSLRTFSGKDKTNVRPFNNEGNLQLSILSVQLRRLSKAKLHHHDSLLIILLAHPSGINVRFGRSPSPSPMLPTPPSVHQPDDDYIPPRNVNIQPAALRRSQSIMANHDPVQLIFNPVTDPQMEIIWEEHWEED
jgi:hypothetical protein